MKGPGPCSPLVFVMVKTAATVHSPFLSGGVPTYSYTYASTLSLKLQGGGEIQGGGEQGRAPEVEDFFAFFLLILFYECHTQS